MPSYQENDLYHQKEVQGKAQQEAQGEGQNQ